MADDESESWQVAFCAAMRDLQNASNCSTRHLYRVAQTLEPYFTEGIPNDLAMGDRKFQAAAGVTVVELVACSRCPNPSIWKLNDAPESCPQCNRPLANDNGDMEVVYYFPLRQRLAALMRTASYSRLLQHERRRKTNPLFFTDVYDTPGTCHSHNVLSYVFAN